MGDTPPGTTHDKADTQKTAADEKDRVAKRKARTVSTEVKSAADQGIVGDTIEKRKRRRAVVPPTIPEKGGGPA